MSETVDDFVVLPDEIGEMSNEPTIATSEFFNDVTSNPVTSNPDTNLTDMNKPGTNLADTNNKLIVKMREMFPDRKSHLNTLLQLYKFIFTNESIYIHEKNNSDVAIEVVNTKLSLNIDADLDSNTKIIKQRMLDERLFTKRLSGIGIFLDFAYLYYIWYYDITAPVYKMPNNQYKLRLIADVLEIPHDKLYDIFCLAIRDTFITDLRIDNPPFLLRTEMSVEAIKLSIVNNVKPICHQILSGLLSI